MKKSVLLFTIIASIFVACNQHSDVDYVNQDVYGIWAVNSNHPYTNKTIIDTLIYYINEENCEFISEDSLIIYHGKEEYTENSDLGYIKYKYEVVKNEKLILTHYNRLYDVYTTREFQWRPDLISVVDSMENRVKNHKEVNGLCGKYEWISTENVGDNTKQIIDKLEKSIIEFKINDFIFLPGTTIPNVSDNNGEIGTYFKYKMEPYTATISKKDLGIIEDKILIVNLIRYDSKTQEPYNTIDILIPQYEEGKYTGLMGGGSEFAYSVKDNKLILKDQYSDCIITFKRLK